MLFDNATDGSFVSSAVSFSFNHTCSSADNRLLLAPILGDATYDLITSASYAGSFMTLLDKIKLVGDRWFYLFYQVAPATGVNLVSVTASGTCDAIGGDAASWTDAYLVFPNNSSTNVPGATLLGGVPFTQTLNVLTPGAWAILATKNSQGTTTLDSGGIIRITTSNGVSIMDSNGPVSSGNNTMSLHTANEAWWGGIMASVLSAGAVGRLPAPPALRPRLFKPGLAR